MALVRRLSVSIGIAVSLAAMVTIASVGAAGGFGSSGGRFTFNDLSANVTYFNPDGSNTNISVDRQLFFSRPHAGGPVQGPDLMTVLSVSHFLPNPDPTEPPILSDALFAIVPDGDFVVSSDLRSATLNTTVDAGTCEELIPFGGAEPAKGGGGCGTGFSGEITVNVTWTGGSVVGLSESNGAFRCGSFASTTQNQTHSAFSSSVTATVTSLGTFSGGAPNVFGVVNKSTFTYNVGGTGILSAACGGGAKGG
jgi:hypothetical protein